MTTITWILAVAVALLGILMFMACAQLSERERDLNGARAEVYALTAERVRERQQHDLALAEARTHAELAEQGEAEALERAAALQGAMAERPLARYERRRVMVNAHDGRRAWRGVLREELDDALILDPCDVLERTGREGWASEAAGEVVIPVGRIDFVQVIRGNDE